MGLIPTPLPLLAGAEGTLLLLALAFACAIVATWKRRGLVGNGGMILATVLLLATFVHGSQVSARSHLTQQRQAVTAELLEVRARLDHELSSDVALLHALHAHIALDPDLDQQRFEALARQLLDGHHKLRNLAAAPDMVVRHVYPRTGNEGVIGLDYRSTPEQREAALRAAEGRDTVLAGPVELIQGGQGIIARRAVYLPGPDGAPGEGRLWGLISTVIDVDVLLQRAGIEGDGRTGPLRVSIRGTDASGPSGPIFLGEDLFAPHLEPVVLPVHLPVGSWSIAAIPDGGWDRVPPARMAFAGALGVLWILMLGLWVARRQLARSEADRAVEYRAMFVESAAPQLLVDARTTRIMSANQAAAQLWGRSVDALQAAPATELVAGVIDPAELASDASAAWSRDGLELEGVIAAADGSHVEVHAFISALRLAEGTPVLHVILEDTTDKRAAERALVQARDAALAASRAKDTFLANMSHEIRTPMNGILGSAQLLETYDLGAEQAELTSVIRTSASSLLRILDDILDLAKIREGHVRITPQPTDLRTLVRDGVTLVRPRLREGVTLEARIGEEVPAWVEVDPTRTSQILANLLSNATKFTESGRIVVEVSGGGDEPVQIVVDDTGIGMTEEQVQRIFEPFEQADGSTTQRYGGTGLGTTISRDLSEQMGGSLEVHSAPGEGSRFVLSLPAAACEAPPDPTSDTETRSFDQRVLVAEDNPVNARIADLLLRRLGLDVVHVPNGAAALDAAQHVDLVFMDIRMPVMDGLEATRALRADGYARPIVALTANVLPEDRKTYLESGFDAVVGKPFEIQELIDVCDRFLERTISQDGAAGDDEAA